MGGAWLQISGGHIQTLPLNWGFLASPERVPGEPETCNYKLLRFDHRFRVWLPSILGYLASQVSFVFLPPL